MRPDARALPGRPAPVAGGGPVAALGELLTSGAFWLWCGIALVCAAVGVAIVHLNPLLIVGGILGLGFMTLIVTRPYLGLVVYTITFLIRPGELMPALEKLHVERLIGAVTILTLLVTNYRATGRVFMDTTRQTKWLIGFWLAAFCSIPMSFWPGLSVERAVDVLKILMFYFMIVHIVDTRERLRTLVWVYILCIVYLACSSLKAYYSGELLFAQGIERVVGVNSTLGDPNTLGTTMAITFALVALMWPGDSRLWARLVSVFGAVTCVWSLSLTGSRASTLGFVTALIALWWKAKHRFLVALVGVTIFVGVFALLPSQYKQRYETIGSGELDDSSLGRIDAWKAGARMISDRPLFGVGLGCFGVAHAKAYSVAGNWLQPHSLYVQVPSEIGLVGAVAYFGFLFHIFRLNRRTARMLRDLRPDWKFERALLEAMFAGLCCLLVSGIFGHSMLRETWYIYAALGLAVHRLHVDLPLRMAVIGPAGPGLSVAVPASVPRPGRPLPLTPSTRLRT